MRKQILITGSKKKQIELLTAYQNERLKSAIVFFDQENFFTTKYRPLNSGVCLIIECESGLEFHIEQANCGYKGGGPNNTVDILEALGLDRIDLEKHVFTERGMLFILDDRKIKTVIVDELNIFSSGIYLYI